MWDSNKENMISLKNSKIEGKLQVYLTNSGKKEMENSRMQKTNDTLDGEEEGFDYLLKSPERDY